MLLSRTASAALLNHLCGKSSSVSIGSNGNCWLGLFTTKPIEEGTGGVEVSSANTNYTRINISSLMSATNRQAINLNDINFNAAIVPSDPDAQTGADWGTIVAFGLFTTQTGGSPYAWGDLLTPVTVNTQNTLHFLTDNFEIILDEVSSSASGN